MRYMSSGQSFASAGYQPDLSWRSLHSHAQEMKYTFCTVYARLFRSIRWADVLTYLLSSSARKKAINWFTL